MQKYMEAADIRSEVTNSMLRRPHKWGYNYIKACTFACIKQKAFITY